MKSNIKIAKIALFWKPETKIYKYLSDQLTSINANIKSIGTTQVNEIEQDNDVDILYIHPSEAKHIPILFEKFPNAKWVQGQFAGVDTFLPFKNDFQKQGAILTNSKGVFSPSLGEFVCAYILYWEKNLGIFHETKKEKNWCYAPVNMLKGKTAGIIGYGNIGIEVAKRLKYGFEMKVIGMKNSLSNKLGEEYVDELVDKSQLEYVVSNSDYLIAILPKTPETDGMFNNSLFSKMKKDSIFINIGRGSSVNEEDLANHLKSKTNLRAACVDVTVVEPLPKTSPLWEIENLFITNHSADCQNDGLENKKIAMDLFVERVRDEYLKNGKVTTNIINFDLGY
jgi:D-2-hydroxyacid dehydrogenase (NADP+)